MAIQEQVDADVDGTFKSSLSVGRWVLCRFPQNLSSCHWEPAQDSPLGSDPFVVSALSLSLSLCSIIRNPLWSLLSVFRTPAGTWVFSLLFARPWERDSWWTLASGFLPAVWFWVEVPWASVRVTRVTCLAKLKTSPAAVGVEFWGLKRPLMDTREV